MSWERAEQIRRENMPRDEARSETQTEMAWLVEVPGPRYLAISDEGIWTWTPDHLKAFRCSRKDDAERLRQTATGSEISYAVQHGWDIPENAAPAVSTPPVASLVEVAERILGQYAINKGLDWDIYEDLRQAVTAAKTAAVSTPRCPMPENFVEVIDNDQQGLSWTLRINFPGNPWEEEFADGHDCAEAAEDWRKRLTQFFQPAPPARCMEWGGEFGWCCSLHKGHQNGQHEAYEYHDLAGKLLESWPVAEPAPPAKAHKGE